MTTKLEKQYEIIINGFPDNSEAENQLLPMRKDMVHLLPMFWSPLDDEEDYDTVYDDGLKIIKNAFENKGDTDQLYGKSLEKQMQLWEYVLGEGRDYLFNSFRAIPENKELPDWIFVLQKPLLKLKDSPDEPEWYINKLHEGEEFEKAYFDVFDEDSEAYYAGLNIVPSTYGGDEENIETVEETFKELAKDDQEDSSTKSQQVFSPNASSVANELTKAEKEIKDTDTEKLVEKNKKLVQEFHNKIENCKKTDLKKIEVDIIKIQNALYKIANEDNDKAGTPWEELLEIELTSGLTYETIVATANAAYSTWIAENKKVELSGIYKEYPQNFLTSSDWASGAGIICGLFAIGSYAYAIKKGDYKGDTTNLVLDGVDLSATLVRLCTQAAIACNTIFEKVNIATSVTGPVNTIAGSVGGAIQITKGIIEVSGNKKIEDRYKKLLNDDDFKDLAEVLGHQRGKGLKRSKIKNPAFKAFDKLFQKIGHRTVYAAIGIGSGAVAMTGGITTTLVLFGVIAGATAWNPVGWVCGGVVLVLGLGTLGNKVGRKIHKKKKLKKLRPKLQEQGYRVPVWCQTTGDFYRYQMATFVFLATSPEEQAKNALYAGSTEGTNTMINIGKLFAQVLFGGDSAELAYETAQQLGPGGIMAFIKG